MEPDTNAADLKTATGTESSQPPVPPPPPVKPQSSGFDPKSFLLPKKEKSPSLDSAQRVSAGVLLEQEQGATLPKKAVPQVPRAAPQKPPAEESVVKPIETYRGAIEALVQKKNVSVVSIAAAEALRRGAGGGGEEAAAPSKKLADYLPLLKQMGMVAGGVALLAIASLLVFWVLRPAPVVPVEVPEEAPFVHVDDTVLFTVPDTAVLHSVVINTLNVKREEVQLSLGLMARFLLARTATSSDGSATLLPLSTDALLTFIAPNVPDTLLRSLNPNKNLLAIHAYDGNQPVLLLEAESYEQAFAGMLEWERTMAAELAPFFTRVPRAHIEEEGIATSTPVSTTPFLGTAFTDDIVENQNARVIKNESGDILLLWAFVNRSTIVITTNEATLREVISRLQSAPIVPTP